MRNELIRTGLDPVIKYGVANNQNKPAYAETYRQFNSSPNHSHGFYPFLSFPQVPHKPSGRMAKELRP